MNTTSLPPLIRQMLLPGFYPHPVAEPVEVIQTHISFVLLTGEYAYKIKKAVDFGFLDFSTPERRKFFCEEELRMNRRTAPQIYLEVLPIIKDGDNFRFGAPGGPEPVEYAVKMKQFPQTALMINMFEKGELTSCHVEMLGRELARIHADAPASDYADTFGQAPKIKESIDNNYLQTEKYTGIAQTRQQYEETKKFSDNFFEKNKEVFEKRVKEKKIRECHGDLHLRNIAFIDGEIVIFDCIEFNDAFRYVDVVYDVAFAVMDMESRGRSDLANIFLNTYMEQTGDWEGLRVLPLYLCRQAYVRAKVNSLMLDDPAVSGEEKEKIIEVASGYYNLAWRYAQSKKGKVFMMSGLSGSGKSTIAKRLAQEINAICIRSDAVRKHLGGIPLSQRGDESLYSAEMTQETYSKLLNLGITLAKSGYTVILDAKYDKTKYRHEVIEAAIKENLELKILHCNVPVDVLRERLLHRSGDITDATANLIDYQVSEYERFEDDEERFVTELDMTGDTGEQLKAL